MRMSAASVPPSAAPTTTPKAKVRSCCCTYLCTSNEGTSVYPRETTGAGGAEGVSACPNRSR